MVATELLYMLLYELLYQEYYLFWTYDKLLKAEVRCSFNNHDVSGTESQATPQGRH